MLIPCPACGAVNARTFTFCQQCGRSMASPTQRPRLPLWTVLALTISGLAAFAFLGHTLAGAPTPGGAAAVANIEAAIPAGWKAQVAEPSQIVLQGDATILLLSSPRSPAADAQSITAQIVDGVRQNNPGASTCQGPEAAPMPGLSYPAIRAVVCVPGQASLIVLTAVSPDQLTVFSVSIECAPESVAAAEEFFDRVVGPTIRWKLAP